MSRGVVLPCHNEAKRLAASEVAELLAASFDVLAVDDGSTDGTADVARAAGCRVLRLEHNVGKGEAVRAGLNALLQAGHDVVAYLDADFAAPAAELVHVADILAVRADLDVALGARVALLGATIERRAHRHYLGRVFATGVSFALNLPIYDSQCGLKVFRATPMLRRALEQPFRSRWIFDVELLSCLLREGVMASAIAEVPLRRWRDVAGSKVTVAAMVEAAAEIAHLMRRR